MLSLPAGRDMREADVKEVQLLIQLKNVSKFYYSKGMIASGISRVNLEFDIGEFVVITGESGSGKTTLLNVISGLDTYEEGEMYIEGRETSHYLASDFEEYRKKYIGNIFQNFNLVNSYTVYQNIELILRINGYRRSDMKQRINNIIKRVGLEAYTRTKVSKLSGGQKQRVAIARALAKDTDIIVADEPTGNLDSQSAQGIVELLSEISKDKLVIVVTHNYEQFRQYATRQIKMHDGKVAEDNILKQVPLQQEPSSHIEAGKISIGSRFRLGARNTFNIFHKFLLLLVVFIFVVTAVTAQYTSYKKSEEEASRLGFNEIFTNYSQDRMILKKKDGSKFSDEDRKIIGSVDNVKSVALNDMLLDSSLYMESGDYYYDAFPHAVSEFSGKLIKGRMPEKENEVIFAGVKDDTSFTDDVMDDMLGRKFKAYVGEEGEHKFKVVGIAYKDEGSGDMYSATGDLFMTDGMMKKMRRDTYSSRSTVTTTINGKDQEYSEGGGYYMVRSDSHVESGKVILPEEANNFYEKGDAKGKTISVRVKNIFYNRKIDLQVSDVYTEKNFSSKTDLKDFETYNGSVFISKADYNKLFAGGNYQASVYMDSSKDKDISQTRKTLETMGYTAMPLKGMMTSYGSDLVSIIQIPVVVIVILALFFIAYFVVRLILKSRSEYFSILRMLGLSRRSIRTILDIEMFIVVNIAFAVFAAVVAMAHYHIINVEYIWNLAEYMKPANYALIYIVMIVMAYIISGKFIRSIFRKSAMGSFREGGQ